MNSWNRTPRVIVRADYIHVRTACGSGRAIKLRKTLPALRSHECYAVSTDSAVPLSCRRMIEGNNQAKPLMSKPKYQYRLLRKSRSNSSRHYPRQSPGRTRPFSEEILPPRVFRSAAEFVRVVLSSR